MMEWRIRRQVDKARARWRHGRWVLAASLVWLAGATVSGLLIAAIGRWFEWLTSPVEAVILATSLVLTGATWFIIRSTRDRREVARRIEDAYPELQTALLAALDVQPDVATGRVGYLQERMVGQVLDHAYRHGWQEIVPGPRLVAAYALHLATLLLFMASLWQLHRIHHTYEPAQAARRAAPRIQLTGKFEVAIEPGNTEIERGKSLLVVARFLGPLPPEATLVYRSAAEANAGEAGRRCLRHHPIGRRRSSRGRKRNASGPLEGAG
jgi:hypothetical protein